MDIDKFLTAYNASRNGTDGFTRHGLVRRFIFSDGVKECAEAGCYWLLDVIATEVRPHHLTGGFTPILKVNVGVDSQCRIALTLADGALPTWEKNVPWTDLPPGEYVFELAYDGEHIAMILISEH